MHLFKMKSSNPRRNKPLKALTLSACACLLSLGMAKPSLAGVDPFIGEIMFVGYNFCPRGWAEANGQLLPIAQNNALFSLYGTTYGGDGRTTFALPDLRGRAPVHVGTGPGLSPISQGQRGGQETVTLTTAQMPAHSHGLKVSDQAATHATPTAAQAIAATQNAGSFATETPSVTLQSGSIENQGGGQAVAIRNPYLGMRACVALQGSFPSRN